MMCPTKEQWYDYKYNLLRDKSPTELGRHQATCSVCSDFLYDLDRAAAFLDAPVPAFAPPIRREPSTTACLDDESWTHVLTGSIPRAAQPTIYCHLVACARCRHELMALPQLLQGALSSGEAIPAPAVRRTLFDQVRSHLIPCEIQPTRLGSRSTPWRALRGWLLQPAFGLALGLGIFCLQSVRQTQPIVYSLEAQQLVDQGTQALRANFGTIRPSDLRLSGGFGWSARQVRSALTDREKKSLPAAEDPLQRAWHLSPQDPQTNHALGRLYLAKKDRSNAKTYLMEALRLNPQSASVHNDLGVLAYELHNFPEAARYFARAMELDPKYAEPVFNAAFVHIAAWRDATDEQRTTIETRQHLAEARRLLALYRTMDPNSDWLNDLESELKHITP